MGIYTIHEKDYSFRPAMDMTNQQVAKNQVKFVESIGKIIEKLGKKDYTKSKLDKMISSLEYEIERNDKLIKEFKELDDKKKEKELFKSYMTSCMLFGVLYTSLLNLPLLAKDYDYYMKNIQKGNREALAVLKAKRKELDSVKESVDLLDFETVLENVILK